MQKVWSLLSPGIGVKRWLLLAFSGITLIAIGVATGIGSEVLGRVESGIIDAIYRTTGQFLPPAGRGLLIGGAGTALVLYAFRRLAASLAEVVAPSPAKGWLEALYSKKHLDRGPRIVVLGGGTGLAVLLRGLKKYTNNLTAIVTVADDGGSSGRLREELGILPPGDIRNCLLALADTEPLMEKLFQYRFGPGSGLAGHSFGNLFIAAMSAITGDFELAVKESSKVLAVRGQVLPSTLAAVRLRAEFTDGSTVVGESSIPAQGKRIARVGLEPADCAPPAEALAAIREADLVLIGPGSLYTSLLPNLLVGRMAEAIRTARAVKVYISNIMTQPGETDGYTAAQRLAALTECLGEGAVDYALVNAESIPARLRRKYEEKGAYPVVVDQARLTAMGVKVIGGDLVSNADFARHDPEKLGRAVLRLYGKRRSGR